MTSSPLSSTNPTPVKLPKRQLDVYTVMLIISFFAICAACTVLAMELGKYNQSRPWDTSEATPNVSQLAPAESSPIIVALRVS